MARFERRGRVAFACAVALALPALIACNSIIGLSDFEKGECPGARCGDGGGFPDQITVDGGPDVVTDAKIDAKGAIPVSWAKWEMPHYDEGGVGLPEAAPPLQSGGAFVNDPTTGLTWRNTYLAGDFAAADADLECKKLTDATWRAPKRIELVTLLSFQRSAPPYLDTTKFMGSFLSFPVWTTSEVRPLTGNPATQAYWVVNFKTGAVESLAPDQPAKVLCVRDK